MCTSDLRSWSIANILEPEFVSQIHMVMQLGAYDLIVTRDKMVYALETNGCLKTGDVVFMSYPMKKIEILCMKDIKTFIRNKYHVLALTKEGEVYSWDYDYFDEEENDSDDGILDQIVILPTLVRIPPLKDDLSLNRIVDIACGDNHFIAMTEFGKVYTWGYYIDNSKSNTAMERGSVTTPMQFDRLARKKVVYISCGAAFTIVIIENGNVYSWGMNRFGQLGLGSMCNQKTPCRIDSLEGIVIVKVVCGRKHTLALTDEGDLYAWGRNKHGQLGIGNRNDSWKPILVEHQMGRVSDIAAVFDSNISIAVGNGGRVFVWGVCRENTVTIPIVTPCLNVHTALTCYSLMNVMQKPFILNANEELEVLKCLKTAFDDPSTSDLMIQVEGQYIHVHKAILKIRSPYFGTMFQHNWVENNQSVIKLDQFSYIIYKAFLKYLYTDIIDIIDLHWEQVIELLDLAEAYCESDLKKECIRMLQKEITVSNVANLYSIAVQYNEQKLKEVCIKFAFFHLSDLEQTENFAEQDQNVIRDLIIKAREVGDFKSFYYDGEWKRSIYEEMISKSNMCFSDLRNWCIFNLLEPEFVSQIHMVTKCGAGCFLIVTRDKMVYALGPHTSSDLDETDDTFSVLYPKKVENLCTIDIKTFICGESHILVLTKEGKVYFCGYIGYVIHHSNDSIDSCYSWSDYSYDKLVMLPSLIKILPLEDDLGQNRIMDIACGGRNFIALTEYGQVYIWSKINSFYKTNSWSSNDTDDEYEPHRSSKKTLTRPMQFDVLHGKKVVYISCGRNFEIVIIENGEVYSRGDNNDYGQLGVGETDDGGEMRRIDSLEGIVIVKVVCGKNHTLALTDEGDLYAWGRNKYGQLGIGNQKDSWKPILVEHQMGRVFDIAAYYNSDISIAVGNEGRVYVWGRCRGQSIMIPNVTSFSDVHDALIKFSGKLYAMHEPLILNTNEESRLEILKCLRIAFNDLSTSDLTIDVRNQFIHVHKAILMIRSSYLKSMFQHDWAENNQSIKLDQFSYIVYEAFLKYLYTDIIDLPWEQVIELLDLAEAYCESYLKKKCIQILQKEITVPNVAYLYSIAVKYNDKELEQSCVKFTGNHMIAVKLTENFAKLDPKLTIIFMTEAGKPGGFRT